jgi:hypothetical protein
MNPSRPMGDGHRRVTSSRTDRMRWRSRFPLVIVQTGIIFSVLLLSGAIAFAGARHLPIDEASDR